MVDCFSIEVRRCCVKAEDVEVGEGKAYIHECSRQLVREGHRQNVLKDKLSFLKTAESSMKFVLFYVSIMAIVSQWYVVR